jgi:mono/diheme cytochrome c family protein
LLVLENAIKEVLMTLLLRRALFSAMLLLPLMISIGKAGEQQTPKKTVSAASSELSGGEIFKSYCSTCHGSDARGKGPMAAVLKVPPPDLTTLSRRNNGKFPEDHIASVLKNGVDIPSHGTAEMPIWGSTFADIKTHRVVTMRVTDMVRYLESIQVK